MDRFLYISPAIVAIIIFIYMKNRQATRNEKMRERFREKQDQLMEMLQKERIEKDKIENNES